MEHMQLLCRSRCSSLIVVLLGIEEGWFSATILLGMTQLPAVQMIGRGED